ncbi:hypothetical protein ACGUFB_01595 [Actinotignum schaalii]|uniref:hypothetical protein n=1 Tax=Actinotignum TaxID=1653174 RepID=UPI002A824F1B|nr:hypothetical protein [Actinotignum sp. SLA_B059]MDY5126902.1 hypothetical protein [Actinotignum sp. SLA_B059]
METVNGGTQLATSGAQVLAWVVISVLVLALGILLLFLARRHAARGTMEVTPAEIAAGAVVENDGAGNDGAPEAAGGPGTTGTDPAGDFWDSPEGNPRP